MNLEIAKKEEEEVPSQNKYKITFGGDPEFFIINRQQNLIPSWECGITGTKGNPEPLPDLKVFGSGILCDGVALEVNIAPKLTFMDIVYGLSKTITHVSKLPGIAEKKGSISYLDTIEVQKKYHASPGFTEIGCTPDLDAYSESGFRPPFCSEDLGSTRFAGGHIHVGCDPWPEWLPKNVFIKFLDIIYNSTLNINNPFLRTKRWDYYGMPGIWRETSYGVEYRTPSSNWIRLNKPSIESFQRRVTKLLTCASEKAHSGLVTIYNHGGMDEFRELFNEGNIKKARYLSDTLISYIYEALKNKRIIMAPKALKLGGYKREYDNKEPTLVSFLEESSRQETDETPNLEDIISSNRTAVTNRYLATRFHAGGVGVESNSGITIPSPNGMIHINVPENPEEIFEPLEDNQEIENGGPEEPGNPINYISPEVFTLLVENLNPGEEITSPNYSEAIHSLYLYQFGRRAPPTLRFLRVTYDAHIHLERIYTFLDLQAQIEIDVNRRGEIRADRNHEMMENAPRV